MGAVAVHSIEECRQEEQMRLDGLKTAAERSKCGQFATPPAIALPFRQVSIDNIFFRDTLISESTG